MRMTGLVGGVALLIGVLAGCGGAGTEDVDAREAPPTEEQATAAAVWVCEEKDMTPCSTPGARRECYWSDGSGPGLCFCNIKGDWLCG